MIPVARRTWRYKANVPAARGTTITAFFEARDQAWNITIMLAYRRGLRR
jgi:hypothetical protein